MAEFMLYAVCLNEELSDADRTIYATKGIPFKRFSFLFNVIFVFRINKIAAIRYTTILMGLRACGSWGEVTLSDEGGFLLSNELFLVRYFINGIIQRQHAGDGVEVVGACIN